LTLGAGCGDDDGDGNNTNENSNTSGFCGDGNVDPEEACDDGSANSDTQPDACRTDCREAYCGDGVADSGEECDDGNEDDNDDCVQGCLLNVCGDGYVNETQDATGPVERCDDGNTADGDDCRGDCKQDMTLCGDGDLDPEEECDEGNLNSDTDPNRCRENCLLPTCGDGVMDDTYGEECDTDTLGGATCELAGYPGGGSLTCAQSCELDVSACCQDDDGDGYGENCTQGPDACDGDAGNWTASGCASCSDEDGDGYRGTGCDASEDACDDDPSNWTASGCASCSDEDGDGYRGTDCDVPEDACEADADNWTASGCTNCVDADGDGYLGPLCDTVQDCDDAAPGITGVCQANGCPQGWVYIPAGAFEMGCDSSDACWAGQGDESPRHTVTLGAYCIQLTEVSVGAFRACKDDSVCTGTPDEESSNPWCNWSATVITPSREDHPINCIDWTESQEYCQQWLGGDLPTEAEWEKAARGTDQRVYPWGNIAPTDCSLCNWDFSTADAGIGCQTVSSGEGPGTWEAGYLTNPDGDSYYGLKDMAGNVWEWTRDWYQSDFYGQCSGGCTDPLNTNSASGERVRRGGSFIQPNAIYMRVLHRLSSTPSNRNYSIGFRCRRAP